MFHSRIRKRRFVSFWDMLDMIVSSAAPKESQVSGGLEQGQGLRCRHKAAIGLIRINGFARPQGSQIQSNIESAMQMTMVIIILILPNMPLPACLFYTILVARWTS